MYSQLRGPARSPSSEDEGLPGITLLRSTSAGGASSIRGSPFSGSHGGGRVTRRCDCKSESKSKAKQESGSEIRVHLRVFQHPRQPLQRLPGGGGNVIRKYRLQLQLQFQL